MIRLRLLAIALGTILTLASPQARAEFETLTYSAEPLPYALDSVKFERPDRREAVVETIRTMAEALMRHSGAFRQKAPSAVTVQLLDIDSSASVQTDASGIGRYAILYRVTTQDGRIIFNDRIHTQSQVHLLEAMGLDQTTGRAARYRAFSQNIQAFLRALGKPQPLPEVFVPPQENPRRTEAYKTLVAQTLASLTPVPTPKNLAYTLSLVHMEQLSDKNPDTAAMRVKTEIALVDTDAKKTIWTGAGEGTAKTSMRLAKQNGIQGVDASVATATQIALRQAMRTVSSPLLLHSRQAKISNSIQIPFHLTKLTGKPHEPGETIDRRALRMLQNWSAANDTDHTLTAIWQTGAPRIRINVQNLKTEIQTSKNTKDHDAEAFISAAYEVMDTRGNVMMLTHRISSHTIPAGATHEETEWALRVALLDNWAGFLKQLQSLAPSLKPNGKTP